MDNNLASPASSFTSDTDAYNTADAKLHFGPLRSPEKKFHPIVACPNTQHSPRSRSLSCSPRLSTPCPPSSSIAVAGPSWEGTQVNLSEEIEDHEEVANALLPGTPEYEKFLQDEPPSVLATKIMRAHGNPSPPPVSPRPSSADPDLRRSVTPSRSPAPIPGDMAAANQGLNCPATSPSLATDSREMQRALLSFDSPLTPPTISPSDSLRASSSELPLVVHPSVDDLLSHSPGSGRLSAYGERASSPSPLTFDLELHKEDRTPGGHQELTGGTTSKTVTSCTSDITLLSEGPSAGLPSSLVHLSDSGSTESQQAATTLKMAVDDKRRGPSHTDGAPPKDEEIILEGYPSDDDARTIEGKVGHTTNRSTEDIHPANQELGSLSPTSDHLLTHLLSSPPRLVSVPPLDVTQDNILGGVSTIVEQTDAPHPPRFPQLLKTTNPNTPIRFTSPIRLSSPTRARGSQHPARSRLQPVALDDPQRTPARRIPIEEAIAQGRTSPQKEASHVGRIPVLNIPPTDSPARRVNVDEAPAPWQGMRFKSPTRSISPAKHRTADLKPSGMSSANTKAARGSQTITDSSRKSRIAGSSSASAISKPRPLPFPIIASGTVPSQSTVEQKPINGVAMDIAMSSPVKSDSPPMSSPGKSSLKQTKSRIPRGIKPYGRPAVQANRQDKLMSTTADLRTRETSKSVRALTRTGTSSDDTIPCPERTSTMHSKSASGSMLKRKRGSEKAPIPTTLRPVVLLRQVPRTAPSADATKVSTVRSSVVAGVKESVQPVRRVPEVGSIQAVRQDSDSHALGPPNFEVDEDMAMPKLQDITAKVRSPSPPQEHHIPLVTEPPTRRRTTRIRKSAYPTAVADVFTDSAPPQARRRVNKAQPSGDAVFSGMSAVALKALTSLNTIRNQKYLAAKLETEVIRKPGARPESPAVKIKPVLQRQRDAMGKERKERADRRARRSDGGQSDTDRQTDAGDSSIADFDSDWDDQNSSPLRKRHKRGPGDEEDYETPFRPRVGEDKEAEVTEEKRRVKWDRGLFTTIYLDEVTVGARRPPKENIATKGCLAATAKNVPLNTLGNLPNAESPLTELVEENVVVKKFVYDTDVEPVQPVVVKNTRLRSKKGKE